MDLESPRAPLVLAFVVLPLAGALLFRLGVFGRGDDDVPAVLVVTIALASAAGPAVVTAALTRRRGFSYAAAAALGFVSLVVTVLAIYASLVLPLLGCDAPGGANPCTQ